MNKQQVKPFTWGVVAGGAALAIVMFASGWAVTSGSAETSAMTMSRSAVVDSLAAICVAHFEAAVNKEEELGKLMATDTWQRGKYVSEQGWATMPGSESPDSKVASACASLIVA